MDKHKSTTLCRTINLTVCASMPTKCSFKSDSFKLQIQTSRTSFKLQIEMAKYTYRNWRSSRWCAF